MCVIYISFCSLASKTRIDVVELIVRKYLLLWWSFCVLEVIFYSLIKFQDKNKFKCTNEAAIGKSVEIAYSDNILIDLQYEAASYCLPQKKSSFLRFFVHKTRTDAQQLLPVQTGLYWYDE